jgi:hypothetical protein
MHLVEHRIKYPDCSAAAEDDPQKKEAPSVPHDEKGRSALPEAKLH